MIELNEDSRLIEVKGNRLKEKISICLPAEMLEVLDDYCQYHGFSRSGGIGYLLARALCEESVKTDGFDFNTPYAFIESKDGEEIVLTRADVTLNTSTSGWSFSMIKSRRGRKDYVVVNDKEIDVDPDKTYDSEDES